MLQQQPRAAVRVPKLRLKVAARDEVGADVDLEMLIADVPAVPKCRRPHQLTSSASCRSSRSQT